MTPEELRADDRWAAEFVGMKTYVCTTAGHLCCLGDPWTGGDLWHPTDRGAPLWQLGMLLEKAGSDVLKIILDKASEDSLLPIVDVLPSFLFQNPAAVIKAIREVVENDKI